MFFVPVEFFFCLLEIFFPLSQNDSSRSFVAGLNSWDASLQPATFFLRKDGEQLFEQ